MPKPTIGKLQSGNAKGIVNYFLKGQTAAREFTAADLTAMTGYFLSDDEGHHSRWLGGTAEALGLVAGGRVTADGFENLRALIDPKRRRGEGRGRMARPRHATGRWAVIETGTGGETGAPATDVEFFARLLLDRWGVVFRDVLARETLAPAWRSLLVVLRQWEARGEVRGGRFVAGFSGEQFARPEAVELLRDLRRNGGRGEEIEIALADPLNLTGVILPGPRTSALAQGVLRLCDGVQQEEPSALPGISASA